MSARESWKEVGRIGRTMVGYTGDPRTTPKPIVPLVNDPFSNVGVYTTPPLPIPDSGTISLTSLPGPFDSDLGVHYADTAIPLVAVISLPQTGQYAVDRQGNYVFSLADWGAKKRVIISAAYRAARPAFSNRVNYRTVYGGARQGGKSMVAMCAAMVREGKMTINEARARVGLSSLPE